MNLRDSIYIVFSHFEIASNIIPWAWYHKLSYYFTFQALGHSVFYSLLFKICSTLEQPFNFLLFFLSPKGFRVFYLTRKEPKNQVGVPGFLVGKG